jgi:hypothetical protein
MNFLKTPILYSVTDKLSLMKTKYNYLINELYEEDVAALNNLFSKLDFKLKTGCRDIYVNGRDTKFMNLKNEVIPFDADKHWLVRIAIQGFKTSTSGQVTPIWKIDEAIGYTEETN